LTKWVTVLVFIIYLARTGAWQRMLYTTRISESVTSLWQIPAILHANVFDNNGQGIWRMEIWTTGSYPPLWNWRRFNKIRTCASTELVRVFKSILSNANNGWIQSLIINTILISTSFCLIFSKLKLWN